MSKLVSDGQRLFELLDMVWEHDLPALEVTMGGRLMRNLANQISTIVVACSTDAPSTTNDVSAACRTGLLDALAYGAADLCNIIFGGKV